MLGGLNLNNKSDFETALTPKTASIQVMDVYHNELMVKNLSVLAKPLIIDFYFSLLCCESTLLCIFLIENQRVLFFKC